MGAAATHTSQVSLTGREAWISFTEDLYCAGWQHDFPDAGAGLGIPGSQPATSFPVDSTADFQCTADLIEVLPLESTDLTPPQTSGQLRVEEVAPDFILMQLCCGLCRVFCHLGSFFLACP